MAKLFNEQKGEIFNISDIVPNRLHTLEGQLSSLISTINAVTGAELALPSTSHKPTSPPRRDSIPMLELNVTQQRNICRNKQQKTRSNFTKKNFKRSDSSKEITTQ